MIDIQFGEGGKDSKMFVDELASAYVKYAILCGLKSNILAVADGHITMNVKGKDAWKAFKHEPGKHVVQRIPPTESHGRRHTSTVSVAVLPISSNLPQSLEDKDIEIKTQGGHGPGGQHQNKRECAVRAIHKPTGLQVFINVRSQSQNKQEALRILSARVQALSAEKDKSKNSNLRQAQMGQGKRSGKVRTYNFIHGRVVDHVLGVKTRNIDGVMRGNFNLLLGPMV